MRTSIACVFLINQDSDQLRKSYVIGRYPNWTQDVLFDCFLSFVIVVDRATRSDDSDSMFLFLFVPLFKPLPQGRKGRVERK